MHPSEQRKNNGDNMKDSEERLHRQHTDCGSEEKNRNRHCAKSLWMGIPPPLLGS